MTASDRHDRQHWLATIGPDNLAALLEKGMPFYAAGVRAEGTVRKIRIGDGILLYLTGKGIVGAFEVSADPYSATDRFFPGIRQFPLRIPWRPVALSVERPVDLRPLREQLQFAHGAANIGHCLQVTIRTLPAADYEFIRKILIKSLN